MRYEEAKRIALENKPTADKCTENEDAYIFECSTDTDSDGGIGPCVVMKDTGEAISYTAYILRLLSNGKKPETIKTIDM